MHLFALAFGLAPDVRIRLREELARTAQLYPQLDHSALWFSELPNGVVAGGVAAPAAVAQPRSYVHAGGHEVVFFDGLPVDADDRIAAHRAEELAARWNDLASMLEGRFALVRVNAGGVELITDPLGVAQVYVVEQNGFSIASNSAGLVARTLGERREDPLGVSLYLTLDWVGGDRTLRRGVRAMPGAQHWTWRPETPGWSKRRYWHYRDAGDPVDRVDEDFVRAVSGSLGRICGTASRINGTINAPLTGGKDSRMLAAILMAAEVPAAYWTKGVPDSLDVQIATEVARRHRLPHRLSGRPTQVPGVEPPSVADDWERLTGEFVAQNDGLASISLVGNIHGQPDRVDRLGVTLSAMCAESARRADAQGYLDHGGGSLARTLRYLPYNWAGIPRGLVSGDAYQLTRDHVRDVVARLADEGVPLVNLSVCFYLDERCRRWASVNPRELAQTEDKVLPFLTRPWVEGVLSRHPDERATHRIHRGIIRQLVPGLEREPRLDHPWYVEVERMGVARRATNALMPRLPYPVLRAVIAAKERIRPPAAEWEAWTPYDPVAWLESNLGWARDVSLSRPSSPLWAYLDRRRFEHLLSPGADPTQRRLHQFPLAAALTMFAYEAFEDRLA